MPFEDFRFLRASLRRGSGFLGAVIAMSCKRVLLVREGRPARRVRLELDKFEGPGADRVAAHVARRYVTGINRRPTGGEQCEAEPVALSDAQRKGCNQLYC